MSDTAVQNAIGRLGSAFDVAASQADDTWSWDRPGRLSLDGPRRDRDASGLMPFMDMQSCPSLCSMPEAPTFNLAPGRASPPAAESARDSPSSPLRAVPEGREPQTPTQLGACFCAAPSPPVPQAAPPLPPVPVQAPHSHGLDRPPPGCSPDAIKLFVGNIPKSCTESQLLPFFETVGKVVDLVVVRDRATHESKGSAFLWFATRTEAESAILQFNMRHTLPSPAGEQLRPMVLRKAKPSAARGATREGHAGRPPRARQGHHHHEHEAGRAMPAARPSPLYTEDLGAQYLHAASVLGRQQLGSEMMDGAWAQALAGLQLGGYEPYLAEPASLGRVLYPGNAPPTEPALTTVTLVLNRRQLSAVNDCMHDVQTLSGAQLNVCAGAAHGLFRLCIMGVHRQVKAARGLVENLFR